MGNKADDSLKCEMCDRLGTAGPCKAHKKDPFSGVIDDAEAFLRRIDRDKERGPRKDY